MNISDLQTTKDKCTHTYQTSTVVHKQFCAATDAYVVCIPRVASDVPALSICPAAYQQATIVVLCLTLLLDKERVWHGFSMVCCVWCSPHCFVQQRCSRRQQVTLYKLGTQTTFRLT
jgi:hypothetical protein